MKNEMLFTNENGKQEGGGVRYRVKRTNQGLLQQVEFGWLEDPYEQVMIYMDLDMLEQLEKQISIMKSDLVKARSEGSNLTK